MHLNDAGKNELASQPLAFDSSAFAQSGVTVDFALSRLEPTTTAANFAELVTPVFVRPLALTAFDGCSLSIDQSPATTPVQTDFADLSGSPDAFKLARLDEFPLDWLTGDYPNLSVNASSGNTTPPTSDLEPFCSFEYMGQCVHCVQGYAYSAVTSSCEKCTGAYSNYSGACEELSGPILDQSTLQTAFTQTSPTDQSQNAAFVCEEATVTDFYAEVLSMCSVDSIHLETGKVSNSVFTVALNPKIADNQLQLPAIYTLYYSSDTGESEYLVKPLALSDDPSTVALKLEGEYGGQGRVGFVVGLPNYRPFIAQGESPVVGVTETSFAFDLNQSVSSKQAGQRYFLNDLCPKYTVFWGLFQAECRSAVPPSKRVADFSELKVLVACGQHCKECDMAQCTQCETGFYLYPADFDCHPCSDLCGDCTGSPDNCVFAPNYFRALVAAVFFYDYQRSGYIPAAERRACWRYHSFLTDAGERGEDLTGGYFNGSGTLKLNFQLSFVAVTHAQTLLYLKQELDHAGVYTHLMAVLRHSLEYLLKCYVDDQNIYSHCGDKSADEAFWGRPEDYSGPRKCYKVPSGQVATDLVAGMASAFAAGSMVFGSIDAGFADLLKSKAEALLALAKNAPKTSLFTIYPELQTIRNSLKTFNDELMEASLLMDLANQDTSHLAARVAEYQAGSFQNILIKPWDFKVFSINFLMFKLSGDQKYLDYLEDYILLLALKPKTSGGFTSINSNQTYIYLHGISMVMFWAVIVSKEPSLVSKDFLEAWVRDQIDYVLGASPDSVSLQVGTGANFALFVNHKGSSCPPPPVQCSAATQSSPLPNPNPIVGAVIGNFYETGELNDSRSSSKNKIELITNAAFPGLLAVVFERFGDARDKNVSLYPSSADCPDGPADYVGFYASNWKLHELYWNGLVESPFPWITCNFARVL